MKRYPPLLLLFFLLAGWLAACGDGATEEIAETGAPTVTAVPLPATPPPPTETPMTEPQPEFRVLAYVTSGIVPEIIPYERLTHINYAFLIPNADGTFAPLTNGWKLQKIVDEAHASGVQVLISVGGWGWDEQFETLAADPASRAAFVQNLADFMTEYNLDGADIDWEYPDPGPSAENFVALIGELRQALPDKLLTTAVVTYGPTAEGVLAETLPLFDFINVMAYDGQEHGTMQQFNDALDYWLGRGLPPDKIVMGLPFYSRPGEASYRKIVEADPQAAYQDTIEWNGVTNVYNGIPTIQAKTRIAREHAGGVMFWTLDHDALGDLSLLKAIHEQITINSEQ